jgi:hypothetical protein
MKDGRTIWEHGNGSVQRVISHLKLAAMGAASTPSQTVAQTRSIDRLFRRLASEVNGGSTRSGCSHRTLGFGRFELERRRRRNVIARTYPAYCSGRFHPLTG